jgi:hypothetical protein
MFVRGKVFLHFASTEAAERALADYGMSGVLLDPRDFAPALPGLELAGAGHVRVIEAMVET